MKKTMVKVPLRKALKEKISSPMQQPIFQIKQASSILPPKKVIRALHDYDAQAAHELSFSKGDFFHVVSNENDPNWYEAYNPISNQRGLVPVSYFQVIAKSENNRDRESFEDNTDDPSRLAFTNLQLKPKSQPLYGVVQYDFNAERPDELDAKAGESIIVIAQSNHEWFVAKPIGRLGGPGLIPVSFIEIRDPASGKVIDNVQEIMQKALVPKVEDWKKQTQEYNNNSIPLGRFEFGSSGDQSNDQNEQQQQSQNENGEERTNGHLQQDEQGRSSSSERQKYLAEQEPAILMSASVESYHFEDEHYWFLIRVELSNGMHRVLYRLYDDLYEFQIALLDAFPGEAGRTGEPRILPFMPGPLSYVNDTITAQRRIDLDAYVKELSQLPEYIRQSQVFVNVLALQEGDVETPYDPRNVPRHSGETINGPSGSSNNSQGEIYPGQERLSKHSQYSHDSVQLQTPENQQLPDMANLSSKGNNDALYYSAATNEYSTRQSGPYTKRYDTNPPHMHEMPPTPDSPRVEQRGYDKYESRKDPSRLPREQSKNNTYVSSYRTSSNSSREQINATNGSREYMYAPNNNSREHMYAPSNNSREQIYALNNNSRDLNYPPMVSPMTPSSGNALIKIKIFHHEDLIAIRVPPDTTLIQLVEKCRNRFGDDWNVLKYRNDSGLFKKIMNQVDLNVALWNSPHPSNLNPSLANKLVLYAD